MTIKPVITDDIQGYYPMNEGSGTSLNDYSGNGNNGTLNNTPIWNKTNFNGLYGIAFNGSNQSITLSMSLGTIYSFSCWFIQDTRLVSTYLTGGVTNRYSFNFGINGSSGKLGFTTNVSDSFNYNTTTVVNLGTLYHVVVTFDGTNKKIYINGTLDNTNTEVGTTQTDTSYYIARDNSTNYFDGKIFLPIFYNRVLTSEEIKKIYNQTYRV